MSKKYIFHKNYKKKLTSAIEKLTLEKEKITNHKEKDKVIKIKKAIPSLEKIIANYYSLSMEERNDSLKFLFDRAIYTRNKKHISDEEQKDIYI